MDLLYHRYASPYSILDEMILAGCYTDFNKKFIEITEEEKLWNIWLHKIHGDKSYSEWKESVLIPQKVKFTRTDFETTINESYLIIKDFNPSI